MGVGGSPDPVKKIPLTYLDTDSDCFQSLHTALSPFSNSFLRGKTCPALQPNFLFDVCLMYVCLRREQWRLWSKRWKHLFASRSLPAWLNWNVREESVFLHPLHSAQHMCLHWTQTRSIFVQSPAQVLTTHQGTGCEEKGFDCNH